MYNALKNKLRRPYRAARTFVAAFVKPIPQKPISRPENSDLSKQVDKALPELHTLRPLLGEEAYDYVQSINRTPGQSFERTLHRIAEFLCHAGLQDDGLAVYETLLKSYGAPENAPEGLIVSYLQMMMFGTTQRQTNERIYEQHVYWSRRFATDRIYTDYANPLTLNRRLKIGYTCHFVTDPISTNSLHPMLKAHNRDRVEVFLYSDEPVNEKTDAARSTVVEHWRDTNGMDTDAFCDLLRKDGIDILVELNGHGAFHRYHEIARHPVPIQATWYNYACTTGVPGMDYNLVSGVEISKMQPYYSETIFHKKGNAHAVPTGNYYPPITPPAFEINGFITFCSFGQAHKVSRHQILLWCEVLKRVPDSKFFMKANVLGEPANRAAFINHFKDGGIDASRLILEGNSDHATLLKCYWRADIALDTYPSNAGTTSIEATMQGLPVISLVGDRYCSQVARAIVGTMGHRELQCQSPQEFVEKAVAMANDRQKLKVYRQTIRNEVINCPRIKVEAFMREMEEGFYELWQRHIDAQTKTESVEKIRAAV